jgi:ferredoxin
MALRVNLDRSSIMIPPDDPNHRDPRNAPGPFYAVEKLCLRCGLPEHEAPDLLAELNESNDDTYFVKQPVTDEEVERACKAMESCCVQALRYAGSDPAIIARLQKYCSSCCDHAAG